MKETYLTEEGLTDFKGRLRDLKTVRRREIAEAIHTAKEQGDLSENAEYASAKEEQRRIEEEISEIEMTLKSARIITKHRTDQVEIGTTVKVICNGQEQVYRIVGSNEADPAEGKVSNESPLGQALLGKHQGDTVSIPAPNGTKECMVVHIE